MHLYRQTTRLQKLVAMLLGLRHISLPSVGKRLLRRGCCCGLWPFVNKLEGYREVPERSLVLTAVRCAVGSCDTRSIV